MSQNEFYKNLPSFTDISQLASSQHYLSVPDDWLIFLTDVKGSTQAIAEGRYKDVNTIGAACIIAVQNAIPEIEFPFVFGGDGASIVAPASCEQKIISALAFIRQKSRDEFKLDLRIAKVAVSEIKNLGVQLQVAKFAMSPGNCIAMFTGGGLSKAEKLMKDQAASHLIGENVVIAGDIRGLQCRWNPVPSQQDGMLTLIVKANENFSEAQQAEIYTQFLDEVHQIVPESKPIKVSNLPVRWPPKFLKTEAQMQNDNYFLQKLHVILVLLYTGLLTFIVKKTKDQAGSAAAQYLRQLTQNTDYLKMDDHLRMVIDVSEQQRKKVLALLDKLQTEKGVFSGSYFSKEALMTCYVQSGTKHVHFIDGGDGGYALAAQELKEKTRAKN